MIQWLAELIGYGFLVYLVLSIVGAMVKEYLSD
jgi:hypothetical protein